jgi:hypothetical protein
MKDTRDYINEIKESMREDVLFQYDDDLNDIETDFESLRDDLIQILQDDLFTYIDNYCIYYYDCFDMVNNLRTFTSFEDCPLGLEITNIQQLAFSMLHAELTNDGTIYDVVDEILEQAQEKREEVQEC